MEYGEVIEYYRRGLVRREVLDYCRRRWVAVAGPVAFARYWPSGAPLKLEEERDIDRLFRELARVRPRTIYASVNSYRALRRVEDVEKPDNIAYSTPVWDIDGSLEGWRDVVEVARVIVDFLESEGVSKSVYIKWSGEGMHVHIHERAFSENVRSRANPLDVAFSVVEYVLRAVKPKLRSLGLRSAVKVENVIDLKRVFTAPLSLHRRVNLACVCIKPEDLDSFEPSWADPRDPRHDERWREFEEGEADALALKALKSVGGYPGWAGTGERRARVELGVKEARKPLAGGVGRFQVMALLQAARYYALTGDLEKAKSFGLNRAIFYAWAKHYGRSYRPRYPIPRRPKVETRQAEVLGERVPVSERGWFAMGGVEQRPEDYDRQVAARISSVAPYEEAWRAALEYVKSFPRSVLEDPQKFYERVYEPVRDEFLDRVVRRKRGGERSILEFFS